MKKFLIVILTIISINDKALNRPINQAVNPSSIVAVILLIFKDSINQATPGSIKDIEELKAAILNKTKNKVPKSIPNGMALKAMGKVTKTKPGPSDGASPFANTMGNIAIPASKATPVSRAATETAVFPIF